MRYRDYIRPYVSRPKRKQAGADLQTGVVTVVAYGGELVATSRVYVTTRVFN